MDGLRTIGSGDLDTLQRLGATPSFTLSRASMQAAKNRLLFRLDEVGASFDLNGAEHERAAGGRSLPPRMGAAISGLHRAATNISFGLEERDHALRVTLGTWSATSAPTGSAVLRSLRSEFAPVRASRLTPEPRPASLTRWGILRGLPAPDEGHSPRSGTRIDQLVRAMAGQPWALSIIAAPLAMIEASRLRLNLLEEMRQVESATSSMGAVNRLTALYLDYLDKHLGDVALGVATGLWRTAVYFGGTDESYPALAGLLPGIFAGERAVHAPLHTFEHETVSSLAESWALPEERDDTLANPYIYQTLLTSAQLAMLIDPPSIEANGFAIRRSARFDVTRQRPPVLGEPALTLGQIKDNGIQAADYAIGLPALNRHVFVTGVTGSGKTNTMFQMLRQLDSANRSFLVMEPSKAEYRALATEPQFRQRMRVFTVGDERFLPLRLNPFEVVGWPAMPLGVHIDLLRSCFVASFGMWTPLPQILERALHEIYRDRGWDPVSNSNSRLPEGADPTPAFPTLADLARKTNVLVDALGYEDRVRNDMRAALLTRINGLRVGGKGAMFDCTRSTPMADLLAGPVLLELQNIGDDDDKAFFMALLFMRLVEYRRSTGASNAGFAHLLVIEEAHRLLANTGLPGARGGDVVEADPRGKAVETFSNLISEVRAYGQGVAVVDQVPTKLAPDVIKNTNIKLVHRIVAEDDRSVLAGAMAMNDEQASAMAVLSVGEAILFEEGEDAPIMVAIPRAKDLPGQHTPTDAELPGLIAMATGDGATKNCGGGCRGGQMDCREAAEAAEEPLIARTFTKIIISTLTDPEALGRLSSDLESVVRMKQPHAAAASRWPCLIRHLSANLADRWGIRRGWSYPEVDRFRTTVLSIIESSGMHAAQADAVLDAHTILTDGAPSCSACAAVKRQYQDGGTCLARLAVDDLIEEGIFTDTFAEADKADGESSDPAERLWSVCNGAAFEIAEFPVSAQDPAKQAATEANARRALVCFGFQMLVRNYSRAPWVLDNRLDRLIAAHDAPQPALLPMAERRSRGTN
ncbi:ATP-binding protein [Agrobacterium rhizogenes]|uniref:ATP-binding protein n=1 Tax=Rhizobium rhizogenes TaxID=359 RepID=UPI0015731FB4|nr:DUF87 domain-containing protein [Rhizobium rhizogenes]NTH66581.1 ATP-binding protein [Rhizobium rhizogenes]NTI04703.1 ATP-binding protein [Rhizobium rhizogenes]NTI11512.1 ATP-binding protein [Rhizobium rhizogenes]